MSNGAHLDCVVIGYNELPFDRYETLLRQYGEESEAYRDINLDDKKLNYVGLLNHVLDLAGHNDGTRSLCVSVVNIRRKQFHHEDTEFTEEAQRISKPEDRLSLT
jgi:hypothetical protein